MARKRYGHDKIKCQRYRDRNTRLSNKIKKISRHLKTHPTDTLASEALKAL